MTEPIPAQVLALASTVPQLGPLPPHPMAWRQTPTGWVIIFDDGRKLTFDRVDEIPTQPAPAATPTPAGKKGKHRA